jgi:hypothetical protein
MLTGFNDLFIRLSDDWAKLAKELSNNKAITVFFINTFRFRKQDMLYKLTYLIDFQININNHKVAEVFLFS